MTSQKLNQRQIFGMKKENLAKKINQYYSETRDLASVLEYIVAILVRNALVTSDFSLFMNELVRSFSAVECVDSFNDTVSAYSTILKSGALWMADRRFTTPGMATLWR